MSTTHEDGHGGSITILEHGDATAPMRFRMILPKGVRPPAPECHPSQTEDYTVLRGTLDAGVIDGKRVVLKAGDTYHIPAGVFHLPANGGDDECELESVLTPGLESGESIHFKAPVRAAMSVAARAARLLGVA